MFRVVVIEDELTVRRGLILTTSWSDYNCEVIGEAKNGKQGVEMILELKPDIVITDIKMPLMNGLEMMEKIITHYHPVFIILTAFSDFNYAKKALQLGAVDYLLKPFNDEELDKTMKKVEEKARKQKQLRQENINKHGMMHQEIIRKISKSKNSEHQNIVKSIKIISEKYNDPQMNIEYLVDELAVSKSYLGRLFKKETTYTFHEFLTLYRMQKACEILKDPNIRVYEVAEKTGYKDQRYFSVVFKKYVGFTPSEFRDNL